MKLSICTLLTFTLALCAVHADEAPWNQFRGPNGDGIANARLPTEFSESKNVRWKVAIPGDGWSSPVVWGDEIWLTTGSDETGERRAIAVDLETGEILKDVKVFDVIDTPRVEAYAYDASDLNSPATPTSVVEEDRIYVHFGSQGIACLNTHTGEKIWERRDLHCYQPVRQGSSPIVDEEALYVAYDGIDKQFFVALDKDSGETLWKTDRNVEADPELADRYASSGKAGDNKKAFATAKLIDVNGQTQVVAPAAEAAMAYDPTTGEELWRVRYVGGFNVTSLPLYAHGMIYVFTSGGTNHLLAVRPDGSGDVTDSHIVWTTTRGTPQIPSPVIVDDLMFLVTDNGVARCLDPRTGDQIWQKRLGGEYWSSPLYANGQLYFTNKEGETKVLAATREAPEIVTNELDGSFVASPAVAGNSLIMRSTTHLYRIQTGYERTVAEIAADAPSKSASEAFRGSLQRTVESVTASIKQQVASGRLTEEEGNEQLKKLQAAVEQQKKAKQRNADLEPQK